MKTFFLVFLGGGLGSMARYLAYRAMSQTSYPIFISTMAVNIAGSLLLGVIMGYALKQGNFSQNILLFLTTGFCGGFTTFSTFAFENMSLLRAGDYLTFSLYSIGSLVAGILAVLGGLFLARLF
ncbi:fluoride efflux transporter CrcB [Antarcticibacterium arcticum]|uniref:Fluoride-specific ion channel FluC n=1 Tax=Antarcticibacterium arcticum TaxID=2585771 RepID=A0A5B8YNJ4_9FLAO|nr:fluoride efflux transporter CrcB [Antarcticibacterium arcticum]QED37826.1 fluoride efflux transporter CrcB [Antarcticibacterium arcticum]